MWCICEDNSDKLCIVSIVQSPHVRLVRVPWVLDHQTFGWKDVEVLYVYIYNQVVRVVPIT